MNKAEGLQTCQSFKNLKRRRTNGFRSLHRKLKSLTPLPPHHPPGSKVMGTYASKYRGLTYFRCFTCDLYLYKKLLLGSEISPILPAEPSNSLADPWIHGYIRRTPALRSLGRRAHLVQFNYLISYLSRDSNVTIANN